MGTNTGLGIGIGIPFKNNALGGDKPYFPPELKARMIGVWTNYGKKNTDADRNIIKNKIPNAGGDLEILNAAYKLNSGFGEYSEDFTTWTKSSKITSVDSESFDFVTNVNWNLLYYKSNIGKDIPSFKVRIKLKGEGKVYYNYVTSEGVFTTKAINSEEYITPISYNTKYTGETPVNCGFTIGISNECSGTITQIPNFEDAFVTDGVNDLIISQKTVKEMIGDNDEITVISMIYYINTDVPARISITNDVRGMTAEDKSSQVFARNGVKIEGVGKLGIYGWSKKGTSTTVYPYFNILGDKTDYESNANYGLADDAKFCPVGEPSLRFMSKQAHYWSFMVIGKLTEDEINLIIGNYNLDRSLKPDILCNISKQGITNDNHAEFNDKLIDYSGNGRDVQMNNLAWKGGSGIAAKPFETIKDYTIVSDEARQKQIQQAANGQQTLQQVSPQQTAKVSVWDLIDAEIEPLTNEQRNMLATNEEYVANYNNLQSMVQAEVLNLVRANIENSPEGKALLDNQLKLVKNLKTSIIEMSQREMQLFNAFKEASAKNPSLTYEEFIKTMK